jgi:hypothetical protein
MQVFEFHFNPKEKEDLIFDTFCYEPENIYERRMGGLFMFGELKNALPHNYHLLEKIAGTVRKEFYSKFQRTHEQALKESLKRSNEFLSTEVSKDNTDWLGNLGFAIISLKNFDLDFTKVGDIKVFLLRGPHIVDMGSKLDNQEIEPYPLKIFNNIVSGKLGEGDMIFVATKEIMPALKDIITYLTKNYPFEEKGFKEFLKRKEKELAEITGAFFVINVVKSIAPKKPKVIFQREIEKFSVEKQVFIPVLKSTKNFIKYSKNLISKVTVNRPKPKFSLHWPKFNKPQAKEIPVQEEIKLPEPKQEIAQETVKETKKSTEPIKIKVKIEESKPLEFQEIKEAPRKPPIKIPKLKKPDLHLPEIKMPALNFPVFWKKLFDIKSQKTKIKTQKQILIILSLVLMLTVGYFIFQKQDQERLQENKLALETIKEQVFQSENLIALKDTNAEEAKTGAILLAESLKNLGSLICTESNTKTEIDNLKNQIENDLKNFYNLTEMENLNIIYDFSDSDFIPQNVISDGTNLYFFSQYVKDMFRINLTGESSFMQTEDKLAAAVATDENDILFFIKPDKIAEFNGIQFSETFELTLPSSDSSFGSMSYFGKNLYFLDEKNEEIIKYPGPISSNKDNPQSWLSETAQRPVDGKSIAIDGSLWILNGDNSLLRYYSGSLQETITLEIYPEIKSISQIYINKNLSYIFLLEPSQERIIISDKQGHIVKQLESSKFDNLLDITVSGNTIWVLNGMKVYELTY